MAKINSNIKNIIIVNDFDYVQGGASKVAIQTANLLVENTKNVRIYYFSSVHNNESPLDERVIKINCSQNEAMKEKNKLRGFVNGIYNFKSKAELEKLLSTVDKDETIINIHGWTKALSSSVFDVVFKKKFRCVLTMHDYFTACPNGGYFNYKKNEICILKPLSLKCCRCNCDSRNFAYKLYRIFRLFIQNKIVKLTDKLTDVISISDFSEKILKKTLNQNTKIHRVLNPIDLDQNPKKSNYKNNKYYLYVGRISKEKGVDIYCKVIDKLNLKGVVVGDGSEKKILEKKYPNISFVGWKNSTEVKKYMQSAKALIFPSRWYEGAPLTPLEALQYEIPIITSNCNAAKDYISKGVNGFTFGNESELIEILKNRLETEQIDFDIKKYKRSYISDLIDCFNKIC